MTKLPNHADIDLTTYRFKRIHLLDYFRSVFMLFVFYHHTALEFTLGPDPFARFNAFAELFVCLSGFVIGMIYLERTDHSGLRRRGLKILATYYAVALLAMAGSVSLGKTPGPLTNALLATLFMNADKTSIGILRFYGLIFLALPILLPLYRLHPRRIFYTSLCLFLITTHLYQSALFTIDSFFLKQVLLHTLSWQFLFVLGLGLGTLQRTNAIDRNTLIFGSALLGLLGYTLEAINIDSMTYVKFPYTFGKFINLLWVAPLTLFAAWGSYYLVKCTPLHQPILSVGRNSLVAFVVSELMIRLVRIAKQHTATLKFPWHDATTAGLTSIALIILIMWCSELFRKRFAQ